MFKKRIDLNDPQNYLPDNQTVGTTQFYQQKIPNLPDYMYPLMEADARYNFSEDEKAKFRAAIFALKKEQDKKLLQEFDERTREQSIDELEKNNLDTNNEQSSSSPE
jgi:hypothetical protein